VRYHPASGALARGISGQLATAHCPLRIAHTARHLCPGRTQAGHTRFWRQHAYVLERHVHGLSDGRGVFHRGAEFSKNRRLGRRRPDLLQRGRTRLSFSNVGISAASLLARADCRGRDLRKYLNEGVTTSGSSSIRGARRESGRIQHRSCSGRYVSVGGQSIEAVHDGQNASTQRECRVPPTSTDSRCRPSSHGDVERSE
jgi:hypothetical protein